MQAVQLANAESDALRATAHSAVHDEQVSLFLRPKSRRVPKLCYFPFSFPTFALFYKAQSGAVQAAVQRIQQLGK